jgi:HNH endonuclease
MVRLTRARLHFVRAGSKLTLMPQGRPAIPADLKRRVLMEAGHRCAIPTCRTVPVELAHIEPYSEVRGHDFENLIALCPTCHTRYDSGDIDRLSMKGYKANLGLISGRYGEMERRMLDQLAENSSLTRFRLPGGWEIQLMYLIKDGLIAKAAPQGSVIINGLSATDDYVVTAAGREFIKNWVSARPVSS